MSKVAIVTGSNKGIGFATVKGLCEKFNGIVYLTARDIDRGKNAIQELNKLGLKPEFHQLDINDASSIQKLHDDIKEKHGGIDVLINNAAIAFKHDDPAPFAKQAEVTIDVNYFGLLRVCKILFPLLRENARVVNISSLLGHLYCIPGEKLRNEFADTNLTEEKLSILMKKFVSDAKDGKTEANGWGNSAYAVSKVGVSALTFIQQKEFDADSRSGIVVNAVHPGYVDTDMTSHKGPLTTEQGAVAPIFAALQPLDDTALKGKYIWYTKEVVDWYKKDVPV